MKFDWDENKNRSNHRKHAVWFEEAQTIWADTYSREYLDVGHSDVEDRFLRVGHSSGSRLLLVVFCERLDGILIRLISARKATPSERKQYEKGI